MTTSRRRRTWRWLGAGVVLVAACVTLVGMATVRPAAPPQHCWLRIGETPARVYEEPGGRVIGGWEASLRDGAVPDDDLALVATQTRVQALVAWVTGSQRTIDLVLLASFGSPRDDGWQEYAVDGLWPADAVADPAVAGAWVEDRGASAPNRWRIRYLDPGGGYRDGPSGTPDHGALRQRWARSGDVLLIGSFLETATGPCVGLIEERFILAPDGQTYRTENGLAGLNRH